MMIKQTYVLFSEKQRMNKQTFHGYREYGYSNGSQNFTADVGYG